MKNNSGFSLVELIVVIAIMAILAGVAVPTYTKYIAKANDAKVMAELDAVKSAAYGAAVSEGETLTNITISKEGVITVTTDKGTADIESFFDGEVTGSGDSKTVSITTSLSNTSYKDTGLKWDSINQKWEAQ